MGHRFFYTKSWSILKNVLYVKEVGVPLGDHGPGTQAVPHCLVISEAQTETVNDVQNRLLITGSLEECTLQPAHLHGLVVGMKGPLGAAQGSCSDSRLHGRSTFRAVHMLRQEMLLNHPWVKEQTVVYEGTKLENSTHIVCRINLTVSDG